MARETSSNEGESERLYAELRQPLLRFFMRRVSHPADAEDLTREAFTRLLRMPVEARVGDAKGKPDRLSSYEVGFRGETKDRSFSADLSAYYIKWDDLQIVATRNGFGVLTNANGGASIRGAEATLTARPTKGFLIVGAFAYQKARVDRADADSAPMPTNACPTCRVTQRRSAPITS